MKRECSPGAISVFVISFCLFFNTAWPSHAQTVPAMEARGVADVKKSKVALKFKSKEPLNSLGGKLKQRVLVFEDGKKQVGHLVWMDKKNLLVLPGKPPIELPAYDQIKISGDGSTILRIGEMPFLDSPSKRNLYWLDKNGQTVSSLIDYYFGSAQVAISEDGYTAVSGGVVQKPGQNIIGLYSPSGKRAWETKIDANTGSLGMIVTRQGTRVAAIMADFYDSLNVTNYRILIFGNKGEPLAVIEDFGIINTFFLLENDDAVFVEAANCFGMFEIETGRTVWKRDGDIRMASSYGAALSPDGNTLFLLIVDWQGRAEAKYVWILKVLDAFSGEEIESFEFPEKYPSTREEVFQHVSDSEIQLVVGNERLIYSWVKEGDQR